MNSIDAAYKVLREAGKPLHYAEIARRAVQSKLWLTIGRTPENTVNRDINQEIMHLGKLARFVRLGDGMYAAVPEAAANDANTTPPDLAFVSDAWSHLPIAAKQVILRVVRGALTGQKGEVDDPVIASVLPDGPREFPKHFLEGDIGSSHTIELPEEQLTFRQLADGGCVVESPFGFRVDVRNETEGMFIVHAHGRGARTLDLPVKMIHLFKAVTGYRSYLRDLWQDLYRAYGRECGDRVAAYGHVKTAFETLGLPPPDEARQALDELGGTAKTHRGLPDDDFPPETVDRPYWEAKGSAKTVKLADRMLGMIQSFAPGFELKYNKHYIGLVLNGKPINFAVFRPQKSALRFEVDLPKDEGRTAKLENAGLEVLEYDGQFGYYKIRLTAEDIEKQKELLVTLMIEAYSARGG